MEVAWCHGGPKGSSMVSAELKRSNFLTFPDISNKIAWPLQHNVTSLFIVDHLQNQTIYWKHSGHNLPDSFCLNYFVRVQFWPFLALTFRSSAEITNGKSTPDIVAHIPGRRGKLKLVISPNFQAHCPLQFLVFRLGRHPEQLLRYHNAAPPFFGYARSDLAIIKAIIKLSVSWEFCNRSMSYLVQLDNSEPPETSITR